MADEAEKNPAETTGVQSNQGVVLYPALVFKDGGHVELGADEAELIVQIKNKGENLLEFLTDALTAARAKKKAHFDEQEKALAEGAEFKTSTVESSEAE